MSFLKQKLIFFLELEPENLQKVTSHVLSVPLTNKKRGKQFATLYVSFFSYYCNILMTD